MALNTFKQSLFKLGMNRLDEPTNLLNGEYALLSNGRTRFGGIEPVKLPQKIYNLPAGDKLQGIFAADNFLLVFMDGQAYYRDFSLANSNFFKVTGGFQLDATVDQLYAAIVPASSMNFIRIPESDDANDVITSGPVQLTLSSGSTPACVIVQDGLNQPWIILPDGSSRRARTYAEWTMTDDPQTDFREYVPIGRQMMYHAGLGILFLVARDTNGNFTNIYRSVTGRPLDFMVNVDYLGNKLPTESEGGAHTVAYRVDYAEITAITPLNANDGGFFVSTNNTSYLVIPNFDLMYFNEPTFNNQALFTTGALNSNSRASIGGDEALIDFTGIRSFNAVLSQKNEGKNSVFSAKIQRLLEGIVQDVTAAVEFDNYGFFGVNTINGPALLVYDTILKPATESVITDAGVWVALDSYLDGHLIKQFAAVKTIYKRALFWITDNNELWEYNASETTATCGIYLGEWSAGLSNEGRQNKEQKPDKLNLVFANVLESGTITADCYLDNFVEANLSEPIVQDNVVTQSQSLPFGGVNSNDTIRNKTLDFKNVPYGYKTGFWVTWNFAAKLTDVTYVADVRDVANSQKSTAEDFQEFKTLLQQ